ncbi:MAG: hypothetical protein Q9210_001793 [Variospora velana]
MIEDLAGRHGIGGHAILIGAILSVEQQVAESRATDESPPTFIRDLRGLMRPRPDEDIDFWIRVAISFKNFVISQDFDENTLAPLAQYLITDGEEASEEEDTRTQEQKVFEEKERAGTEIVLDEYWRNKVLRGLAHREAYLSLAV